MPSDSAIRWPLHPLDPEVGVLGAEAPGLGERGVGQVPQRQGGELRVDSRGDWSSTRAWSLSHRALAIARPPCGTLGEPKREVDRGAFRAGDRREPGYRAGHRAAAGGRRRQRHGDLPLGRAGGGAERGPLRRAATRRRSTRRSRPWRRTRARSRSLVANAGITRDQLLALMSEDDFTAVLDTNLTGAYRVAKRAVRPHDEDAPRPADLHLLGGRACTARPARPTTRRPRPGWSAWPARWPASSARATSPPTWSRPASWTAT